MKFIIRIKNRKELDCFNKMSKHDHQFFGDGYYSYSGRMKSYTRHGHQSEYNKGEIKTTFMLFKLYHLLRFMKRKLTTTILLILFAGMGCTSRYDKEDYHWQQNEKLVSSAIHASMAYTDSARMYFELANKEQSKQQLSKARSYCDSVTKYTDIAGYINNNTPTANP